MDKKLMWINHQFFFSKFLPEVRRQQILGKLVVQVCDGAGLENKKEYLCLFKRSNVEKTHWWKEKLLSKGGKEFLINAVLQAISTYAMPIYKLPITLCKELHSIIRSFWWKSSDDSKGMTSIAWDKLCWPNLKGDMGFKNLQGNAG